MIDVDEATTSYVFRGDTIPGASVSIATPDRDPYTVNAESDGAWSARSTCAAARNQFDVSAIDPETGKRSEDPITLFITVPFLGRRGADAAGRPAGRGRDLRERGDPRPGHVTNATSVVVAATYVGPTEAVAEAEASPPPPASPRRRP